MKEYSNLIIVIMSVLLGFIFWSFFGSLFLFLYWLDPNLTVLPDGWAIIFLYYYKIWEAELNYWVNVFNLLTILWLIWIE